MDRRTGGYRTRAPLGSRDRRYGHIRARKIRTRTRFLEFARHLRTLYPGETRIALVADNFSPHLATKRDQRVGAWTEANNVETANAHSDALLRDQRLIHDLRHGRCLER